MDADIHIALGVVCSVCTDTLEADSSSGVHGWQIRVVPCDACLQKVAEKGVC